MKREKRITSTVFFIAVFCLLLLIALVLIITNINNVSSPNKVNLTPTLPPPSPTKVLPKGQYSVPYQGYIYKVPLQLSPIESPSTLKSFTFVEGGQGYRFIVSPPGDQNLEFNDPNIVVNQSNATYNGIHFSVKTWVKNGTPFLIHASVLDQGNFYGYDFSIQLPPTNTDKYIQMFYQILGSLHLSS